MKFFVDTNAILYFLYDRLVQPLPKGTYFFSVITEIELFSYPNITAGEEESINRLLASMTRVELNLAVREQTIIIRRECRMKLPDAIIAASALVSEAILISNDVGFDRLKHLQRIELQLKTCDL